MKNNTQTLQERLRVAEEEIAFVRKQLEVPEPVVPVVPWEPSGGEFYLNPVGTVEEDRHDTRYAEAGVEFQTRRSAEEASEFYRFYHRLYKLAMEVNAKHTTFNSCFSVKLNKGDWIPSVGRNKNVQYELGHFFISYGAAQEACDIMNRDGWVLPTM